MTRSVFGAPGLSVQGSIVVDGGPTFAFSTGNSTPATTSVLAYNSGRFKDFYAGHMFLNLAKQFRNWYDSQNNKGQPAFKDANGYYTAVPTGATRVQTVLAWDDDLPADIIRRYAMTYTGAGTITFGGTITEVSRVTNTNGETITFDITGFGNALIYIDAIPDPANYPREFVMVPTATDWQARLDAGEIFTPEFLAHIRPNGKGLAFMRHLNLMLVNDSTVQDFADLPTVDAAVYTEGVPLEILCEMAKQGEHPPWWCIPHQASDQFVTDMANFIHARIPEYAATQRVEYINEFWNGIFSQFDHSIFKGAERWGTDHGLLTVTSGSRDIVLADATGITTGGHLGLYDAATRTYDQANIAAVNGNTITMDRNHPFDTGQVQVVTSETFYNVDYHALRSTQIMGLWTAATGTAPIRVMGSHVARASITEGLFDSTVWQAENDPAFVDPATVHDEVAVTSYFYAGLTANSSGRPDTITPLIAAFASSDAEGRTLALDNLLTETGIGLDLMEERLIAQRAACDVLGKRMVLYEGGSDHTVFSADNSAAFLAFVDSYEAFIYSTDFNPVWQAHFALIEQYIDGPWTQYSDIFTPSNSGIWGLYRFMGETNARATEVLRIAATKAKWW